MTEQEREMQIQTLGERLFWARRNHARVTQKQLRDKMKEKYGVEIGRSYISQLETDDGTRPTFEVVRAMAGALEVSLDYLAGFTENLTLGQREDGTPDYFSAEADEMARLVDAMKPAQRTAILSVAQSMVAPTQLQLDQAEANDIMQSIEDQFGGDVRREVERIVRGKRSPADSAA